MYYDFAYELKLHKMRQHPKTIPPLRFRQTVKGSKPPWLEGGGREGRSKPSRGVLERVFKGKELEASRGASRGEA